MIGPAGFMAAPKAKDPDGFICECGKFHPFCGYVAAHWDLPLTHTCDECGAMHDVLRGVAELREPSHRLPTKKLKK